MKYYFVCEIIETVLGEKGPSMARIRIARHCTKKLLLVFPVFCSVFLAQPVFAGEWNAYAVPHRFTWREFVEGERAVMESGLLFGLGISYFRELEGSVTLRPAAEIFGGNVDYEGQACDGVGVCVPATSTVNYFGLKLEADIGGRFRTSGRFIIEPFGGLGFRVWTRDINNGTTADGSPTAGYVEDWLALYARLGTRANLAVSERRRFYAEAGVKLPIYNENTAYVSDIGQGPDITMNPGKQAAFFAEAGVKISKFRGSIFYDSLRFPQSPPETNGFITAYQPRSTMDLYGFRLGFVF